MEEKEKWKESLEDILNWMKMKTLHTKTYWMWLTAVPGGKFRVLNVWYRKGELS